jgi:formylglycine-generating enzyme required for sulfatase activity
MGERSATSSGPAEPLHSQRIRRSFAIAAKETTVEQFQRFLSDHPQLPQPSARPFQRSPDVPQTAVTWYEAAAYCNWLSVREGLSEDQWCYLVNADGRYAAGMRIAEDYLNRDGYRLPTEAEWEYACRAGANTQRCFGDDDAYLEQYAVFQAESLDPAGRRKPSDFGLFDVHGNAAEWCQDRYLPYPSRDNTRSAADSQRGGEVADDQPRAVRGGSFRDPPSRLRCAARSQSRPSQRDAAIGFRVARRYP